MQTFLRMVRAAAWTTLTLWLLFPGLQFVRSILSSSVSSMATMRSSSGSSSIRAPEEWELARRDGKALRALVAAGAGLVLLLGFAVAGSAASRNARAWA